MFCGTGLLLFLGLYVYWSCPYNPRHLGNIKGVTRVVFSRPHFSDVLIDYCLDTNFSVLFTASNLKQMDFRTRDQTWLSRLQEVFREESTGILTPNGGDSKERIVRLRSLLHRRTKLWWNRASLGQYLARDLIPRGLRIQIFPSFVVDDDNFKRDWENLATKCSRGFMELLMRADEMKLGSIEKEIDDLQVIIKDELTSEAMEQLNSDLEKDFSKWEQEIGAVKTKKLQRDNSDYQGNKVYRWKNNNKRSRPMSQVKTGSISSLTSVEESSVASDQSRGGEGVRKIQPGRTVKRQFNNKRKISPSPAYERKAKNTHLEVINLSSHSLSETQVDLLKLGLNFVPSNKFDFFTVLKDTHLFCRKLILKKLHSQRNSNQGPSDDVEQEALEALEDLLREQSEIPVTHIHIIPSA
ncbi:uncharacterized protein [Ranitomeya imitator]|uniref:uncharacterized protein n=1 Tax=Ranitomeya imitator TaxID=111125 RepID=UPI0037E84F30